MSGEDVTEADKALARGALWRVYGGPQLVPELVIEAVARALAAARREEGERIIKLIHADLLNPATAKCLEDAIRQQAEGGER